MTKLHTYLLFSYSIELSHMPKKPDKSRILTPRYSSFDKAVMSESDPVQDIKSFVYQNQDMLDFRKQIYWDAARAFLVTIQDVVGQNPKSRVPTSQYQGKVSLILNELL